METKILANVKKNGSSSFIVRLTEFKDIPYIDIREHFINKAGDLIPTKKGVSLTIEKAKELLPMLGEIGTALNANTK